MDEIIKAIALIEKLKADLTSCDKNLRFADDKLGSLDFLKLLRKNETVAALYESQRSGS